MSASDCMLLHFWQETHVMCPSYSVRAQNTDPLRFSPRMGAALAPHWRKSSQWFALLRAHAGLVLADQHVLALFAASCRAAWDADVQRRALAPASSLMPHALKEH